MQLILELDDDLERLSGSIRRADRALTSRFEGAIALVAAVERLRSDDEHDDADG